MNNNERKALISFLSIYIGSAILLIGLMLYFYYQNEMKSVEEHCDMQMSNAANEIKANILNAYMKGEKFEAKPLSQKQIQYALFDENRNLLFSNMQKKESLDFAKKSFESQEYTYFIAHLNENNIPIKHIVVQTCSGIQNKNALKIIMVVTLIISSVFIGFIAYLLAKLLLKPVREKVEMMDKFIKDSAHELNTPIAVLSTSVSMLKKGKDPEKMMRYIISSSKQISQLYNDIHFSAFNEIDESVEESFYLDELIEQSVEYYNDISITKNIKINSKLIPCKIKADKRKIQKIVNNLLSNAVKYSYKDSFINVKIEKNILIVEDFGEGMNEQLQKEMFKRYKRGNSIESGFGIGLDIVKNVAKEYDLKIDVKSIVKQGTVFKIDFKNILE